MNEAVALPEPAESHGSQPYVFTHAEVERMNALTHARLREFGAVRVQAAFFRCPWPCSRDLYQKVRKVAIDRWVGYMEGNGWALVSKVRVRTDKRRTAHATKGDWYSVPVFDEVEIPVAAAFKKTDLQIIRTEVPVA